MFSNCVCVTESPFLYRLKIVITDKGIKRKNRVFWAKTGMA